MGLISKRAVVATLGLLACAFAAAAGPLSEGSVQADEALASIEGMLKPTAPATLSTDQIDAGNDIMTVPVTYVFTGKLRSELREGMMLGLIMPPHRPIPAGTPLFAIATNYSTGIEPQPKLLWCAASIPSPVAEKLASNWSVTCFPGFSGVFRTFDFFWDRFPVGRKAQLGGFSSAPDVEETAVDLQPGLTAVVRFTKWDGTKIKLQLLIRQPAYSLLSGSRPCERVQFDVTRPIGSDGAVHIRVFGDELAIRPTEDGRSAVAQLVRPADR